ncbi:MAG: VWA domain-containing protein, partial [Acholeplasmatales bacterium]|nr:VWA domain-containing protein [Acholeplasmatales bacterium]
MSSIRLAFSHPWLLLLIIPVIGLALYPHLKLNKHRRRTRNRITSLVLHIIVSVMAVLLLSGMSIKVDNSLKKNDVIFLIDASDSTINIKEEMDEYLENVIDNFEYENKIGFVAFGNEQITAGRISSNVKSAFNDYKNNSLNFKKNATNFEEALIYSIDLLDDNSGRIIILTDGRETDGNAIELAKQYSTKKVQIDAVYFDSSIKDLEVQINGIILQDDITINTPTNIGVDIQSNRNCIVNLQIYDNDKLIKSEAVSMKKGINEYTFKHVFDSNGIHELKCLIDIKDSVNNNNAYYSVLNIVDENKILIIDGTGAESQKLNSLISSQYNTTVVSPQAAYALSNNLNSFGEIILMNTSNADLTDDFVVKLEAYVRAGGSLLTTGGKNTYYFGEMANTRFSEMLPIEIKFNENEPISIFIVLDISSSMNQTIGGSSKTKLELAKEGAIESVKALNDYDYVGVIAFDANAKVVVPLTPVSQKNEIIKKIEDIDVGYGTAYLSALNLADAQFIQFDKAKTKHIIFLSDGVPTDSGYTEKLINMRSRGVTASTFGIGDDVNTEKLEELATAGGGNFYKISSAYEFNEYMVLETVNKKSEYLNEGSDFTPKITSYTPIVNNITSLPSLSGYIGAVVKEGVTTVLSHEYDPIYCEWDYGDGKVGSFMSDLSGNWSAKYFEDSRGITLINNIVKNLYADNSQRKEMVISIEAKNFTQEIEVRTASN